MKMKGLTRLLGTPPSLRKFFVDQRRIHSILRGLIYAAIGSSMVVFLYTFVDVSPVKTTSKSTTASVEEVKDGRDFPVDLKRDVARDLKNALGDLKRAKDYNQAPPTHSLLQLERILGRLDPRLLPLEPPDPSQEREQFAADDDATLVEVCPEHYKGRDEDDLYHTASFEAKCSSKVPLEKLVSIAIDGADYKRSTLNALLDEIFEELGDIPVSLSVLSKNIQEVTMRYPSIKIVRVTSSTPAPVRWARLIRSVTTKYILLGYNMAAFSPDANIERLIRVYRQVPYASFVSGATRNETGHWTLECYQSRLELYGMALREGYTNSAEECMYCDAVSGPFLTTTKMFTSIPLDEHLPIEVVFVDWFQRIRDSGGLGLMCPDVLFFTRGYAKSHMHAHIPWRKLAAKLGLTDIYLPSRIIHRFSCDEAGVSCNGNPQYFASPPCCVARLSRTLREAITAFDKAAVGVHISHNTVVGGVKGGLQPWDAKAYLTSGASDKEMEFVVKELQQHGFTVSLGSGETSEVYHLNAHNHQVVLFIQSINMKGKLPPEERETPTRIHIGNGWVPAPPNPGLYARGYQGRGSLQHRPSEGSWPRCEQPSHHACLDHLPLDGSWTRLR